MDRNEPDLSQLIAGWLKKFPSAKPIAGHILRKAESNGAIAKTFTLPFDKASHQALAALFSAKFVRQSSRGEKTKVFFEQWETETNSDNGVFLELLSRACGHDFKNRKQAKSERYAELKAALSVFFNNADGLSRLVAQIAA